MMLAARRLPEPNDDVDRFRARLDAEPFQIRRQPRPSR